jgi:SAM-dependent methyltransferase
VLKCAWRAALAGWRKETAATRSALCVNADSRLSQHVQRQAGRRMTVEPIYQHPEDYELEVASQRLRDEAFWSDLVRRERPRRVLEIGCGTGRLTIPLAREGMCSGFTITGLDTEAAMLDRACQHLRAEPEEVQRVVCFIQGDARDLSSVGPPAERFDVILAPYGVAHHFLTDEDRLAAWQAAHGRLPPGGLFAVDITMPDAASLAGSQESSPRALDLDVEDVDGRRLRRTVAQRYDATTQRLTMEFQYEVTEPDGSWYAYPSTFVMYVYHLQELTQLFQRTRLTVERLVGSYAGEPYDSGSHQLIALARPATP